jgi:gamma-glutamylcyclotransferase (GGCT)/AIG2-like uncharacterized protein YtfP
MSIDDTRRPGVVYLFVYGTLKRGERNHGLLAGQYLVGEAVTEPCFRLLDCGAYPALIESEQGLAIRGEVYRVDENTLRQLDVLEEAPHLFRLLPVQVRGFAGTILAYLYQQDVSRFRDCGENWTDPEA